ncbi:MAG: C40 family peptidase [Campylobacterota bacterium]|nr:C40 family peptidase [Campylobacterota bacterium]
MKFKLLLLLSLLITLVFTGCTKPYSYPNYDIIKPSVTCKPKRKNIEKLLSQYLDKPYVWAEEGPHAFDCSGLTYNIYGQMGVKIPRVAWQQSKVGKRVQYGNLQYGDLIFFGSKYGKSKRITHVGIYLGDGWFAHASSKERKVTYTNFKDEPVYLKRMKVCRRYLSENEKKLYMQCDGKLKKMKTTSSWRTTPWQPGMKMPRKAVP